MGKILGIDLGTNSIGWCLLDDTENNEEIIDIGVRVFEAGVSDINTKNEASRNSERREKRQARRQLLRRTQRKKKLIRTLLKLQFLTKLDREEFIKLNPYQTRAKAIREKVSLVELSRIFYHIIQRRGFKSSRKQKMEEKEKGAIYEGTDEIIGINKLREEMKQGNFKTIGEYFATLNETNQKIRARYIDRKMYEEEFELIWQTQKQYYPELLTEKNYKIIKNENLFYQRPLKSQKHLVGRCIFEKNNTRAYRSSIEFQEFRMLQQVNQLRIISYYRRTDKEQQLTEDERRRLLEYLYNNEELKLDKKKNFQKFKKILGIAEDTKIRINLEHLEKLDGMKTLCKIKEAFGAKFEEYEDNPNEIQIIWNTLNFAEDDEWLKNYAKKRWGLDDKQAEKFAKINLEKGYANLSLKAIKKILPYLREGYLYHQACKLAGYDHSLSNEIIEKYDLLPPVERIANPIVYTSLSQMRKVINNLIRKYGKPDIIRIEMGRDLKLSKKQRLEILRRNKENEKNNEQIKEILINEIKISEPSKEDIIKYKLWKECGEICPYTGKRISADQLFGDAPEFQIEHILPYSRTLDDSIMNKTLCYVEENIKKGNNTPYEYYSSQKEKYEKIKERIKILPDKKAKRFLVSDLNEFYNIEEGSDFINRQLNDMRYVSKLAKNLAKHICDEVNVTKGEVTAKLRYFWGLNSLLKTFDETTNNKELDKESEKIKEDAKIRSDHRHHAIDAAVIAMTNRSTLQKLSTIHGRYGKIDENSAQIRAKFPPPWQHFREQLAKKLQTIIVSHKFRGRAKGKLHEETYYSKLYNPDGTERLNDNGTPLYAIRKKLENLTAPEIHNIIDPVVKRTILEYLGSKGIYLSGQTQKLPNNAFSDTIYMPCKNPNIKIPIKSVRIAVASNTMIQLKKNYNVWVEPSKNHHMIIYADETGKIKFETISLFEAARRKARKQPVINKNLPNNCEFITSLQRNEMLIIGNIPEEFDPEDKETYPLIFEQVYRVQKMDKNGNIVFRKHYVTATSDTDSTGIKRLNYNTLVSAKFVKVIVDSCGFINYEQKNHLHR